MQINGWVLPAVIRLYVFKKRTRIEEISHEQNNNVLSELMSTYCELGIQQMQKAGKTFLPEEGVSGPRAQKICKYWALYSTIFHEELNMCLMLEEWYDLD